MISRIDRKRIFIFVAITHGITIALAVVISLNGGLCTSCPFELTRLAHILLAATMFAAAVANIVTRLITREGWSNTFLRPSLRRAGRCTWWLGCSHSWRPLLAGRSTTCYSLAGLIRPCS